jgi:hypothetical protein
MRDLYREVRSARALRGIPVYASSEAGGSEPDNVGQQFLTIPKGAGTLMPDGTRFADYANTDTYPQRAPGYVDNLGWNVADPTLNGAWDGLYGEFGQTWNRGFANFTRNRKNTFVYMLRDDPVQGFWGLIDTDYQPKLSGVYLHNLTTILRSTDDPTAGTAPISRLRNARAVDLTLTGYDTRIITIPRS